MYTHTHTYKYIHTRAVTIPPIHKLTQHDDNELITDSGSVPRASSLLTFLSGPPPTTDFSMGTRLELKLRLEFRIGRRRKGFDSIRRGMETERWREQKVRGAGVKGERVDDNKFIGCTTVACNLMHVTRVRVIRRSVCKWPSNYFQQFAIPRGISRNDGRKIKKLLNTFVQYFPINPILQPCRG